MSAPRPTAQAMGLVACHACGALARTRPSSARERVSCPICGARLESRIPNTFSRAWALVVTGFILYIPANLFPIMTVEMLGGVQHDTILSGVTQLFQANMWAIGLLVFGASIVVPLLKLVALSYLLVTTQRRWRARTVERTRLFRLVEAIGRWSMLDVFLLSILVAVVNLGEFATITPDIGAVFFAAVVIITMFAAELFDPRKIWDHAETRLSS